MARDIDIALLRAFTAVIETGSVTAAARLINRTQAAVSLQIKRLEDQLGVELFLREHKKLRLAAAGERLLAHAQKLVTLNDEVWAAMTTPAFQGKVRLGVPMDIVGTYIPSILRRFNQAWPRVEVTVDCQNSHDLLQALDAGEVDITLTTDESRLGSVARRTETLRMDQLVWIGAPNSRAQKQLPLPLAIGSPTCRFRPVALDALRSANRDWRLVSEVANDLAQKALVLADIAVSTDLRSSIQANLVELGPDAGLPALPSFAINLSLPITRTSDTAEELARHIRTDFALRFGDTLRAVAPLAVVAA
jgi:DNA-binding transcriptional LysR family regulator